MANVKVIPRSLTEAYKRREGDFSPNLVGFQFTDGVSLFTFGNFQITTNVTPKLNKNFVLGGQWSDYYSLNNLNLSESQSEILLSNEIFIRLNFDPKKIDRYIYFGSFHEYVRVTIEQIIQKWKAALFISPTINTSTPLNTVLSFSYNFGINEATFLIPKSGIDNPFELIIDDNNDFVDLQPTDIFNLSRDYKKYTVSNDDGDFKIIKYTGSTEAFEYIRVVTEGNPFPTLTASTFGQYTYHVKPNDVEVELFFTSLNDFEKILLNRLTVPIYTSTFEVPRDVEGVIQSVEETYTWPVSDGYNIDINTRNYALYVEKMLNMAILFDENKTDLMARRFVSESIHEFDTNGGMVGTTEVDTYGRKVNKLLRIYGREYDEVKKYIDGISFANVVTYSKLDNTSDELIKIMAKTLGFDVLLTVGTDNFDLLEQIKPSYQTPFSGYSRSLSSIELDIEMWRRLVINAWWLFRSKGTRKVIEFFFSLFKIPECMVTLNEYIYLAENRLDVQKVYEQVAQLFELNGIQNEPSLSDYPMDLYGFPRVLPETNVNYFQMDGFWYNGGTEITTGNNPHIGPYDYGQSYFNQFECFVPEFMVLSSSTLVTEVKNYFNNYNKGTFIFDQNGLPVPYYGNGYANVLNNNGLVENVIVNSAGLITVGDSNSPNYGRPSGDTYSMKVSFTAGNKGVCDPCGKYQLTFGEDGVVYVIGEPKKPLTDPLCCKTTYYLPLVTSSTEVCPKPEQLSIATDGTVLNAGQPIPQTCCSKSILGFAVAWDGRNCVVPQQCPDPASVYLTLDGSVVDTSTNTSVSQNCCSPSILGFDVIWDGTKCTQVVKTKIDTVFFTAAEARNTLSAREIKQYAFTPREVLETATRVCYWCPPKEYIQVICNTDEYLDTLTEEQIIQIAISFGAPSNVDIKTAIEKYFVRIYKPFFEKYGCLILDLKDNNITDKACCGLRGGTLTEVNGRNYCLIKPTAISECTGAQVLPRTNIWYLSDGKTLLPQSCCNQNGQYWVSPVSVDNSNITLTLLDGTVDSFLDINTYSYTNSYSYCSSCPNSIKEIELSTGEPVIVDTNGNTLTQQCCVNYGFTWDSNLNICSRCSIVLKYVQLLQKAPAYTEIVDQNDNSLGEYCCEIANGWYGDVGYGKKCYTCPGITIPDATGTYYPNPEYTLILQSNGVDYEILYNGTSLTENCCALWRTTDNGANVTWNSSTNKCLLR